MAHRVSSGEGFSRLKDQLRPVPGVKDVIIECRTVTRPDNNVLFVAYDSHDVFVVVVESVTEDIFESVPNSWFGTPVEILDNGTRERIVM